MLIICTSYKLMSKKVFMMTSYTGQTFRISNMLSLFSRQSWQLSSILLCFGECDKEQETAGLRKP